MNLVCVATLLQSAKSYLICLSVKIYWVSTSLSNLVCFGFRSRIPGKTEARETVEGSWRDAEVQKKTGSRAPTGLAGYFYL